jgi:hypothetical protein
MQSVAIARVSKWFCYLANSLIVTTSYYNRRTPSPPDSSEMPSDSINLVKV